MSYAFHCANRVLRAIGGSQVDSGNANVEAAIASLDERHRQDARLEAAYAYRGMTIEEPLSAGLAALRRVPQTAPERGCLETSARV